MKRSFVFILVLLLLLNSLSIPALAVEPVNTEACLDQELPAASDPQASQSPEEPAGTEAVESAAFDAGEPWNGEPAELNAASDYYALDSELMQLDIPIQERNRNSGLNNYVIHDTVDSSAILQTGYSQ